MGGIGSRSQAREVKMDLYGVRRISSAQLLDYCRTLNINLPQQLNANELNDELGQVEPAHPDEQEFRYSYWQIHQIFGMVTSADANRFDTLASWIEDYRNARDNSITGTKPSDVFSGLLAQAATRIAMPEDDCYGFLCGLINLHERYKAIERYNLASVVERDIFYWEQMLQITTGAKRHEVAEKIGEINEHSKKTFRYFDIREKERDDAWSVLNHFKGSYFDSVTTTDIDALLDYCKQPDLSLLITALSGMVAHGDDEYSQKFRHVTIYTNLKNLLHSFEYLLKNLAMKGGYNTDGETLTPTLRQTIQGESCYALFQNNTNYTQANNTAGFLNNLSQLLADSSFPSSLDGRKARVFLMVCLSRNFVSHSFPEESSDYSSMLPRMLENAVFALFSLWQLGKNKQWV